MSRKYLIFPEKLPRFPDSRQNLQIPGIICFSPETAPVRAVTPRNYGFHEIREFRNFSL